MKPRFYRRGQASAVTFADGCVLSSAKAGSAHAFPVLGPEVTSETSTS
jgi:hypothetical protein